MKHTLLLYLDEHWPKRRDCPWVVIDTRSKVVEQGCTAPAHWPAAAATMVVLGGGQCVQHSVRLPRSTRREEPALIRYALEEKLVDDVDQQHFVLESRTRYAEGQRATVLVIGKPRLRQLLAELKTIGRAPSRMVAELQLPALLHPSQWTLAAGPTGSLVLSAAGEPALSVDPDSVDAVLGLLLQQTRSDGENGPTSLRLLRAASAEAATPVLSPEHAVPMTAPADYPWWQACERATDLLVGEFAPARRTGGVLSRARVPLTVAALALAVLFVANLFEMLSLRSQLAETEARIQRTFTTALPGVPPVAPVLQARRELDLRLAAHGKLTGSDFLQLLDITTEAAGESVRGQIDSIEFDEGVLKLRFRPGPTDVALIVARLDTLGWPAQRAADNPLVLQLDTRQRP